jgi:hypothetical protein
MKGGNTVMSFLNWSQTQNCYSGGIKNIMQPVVGLSCPTAKYRLALAD